MMERLLDLYRDICKIPNLSSAIINRTDNQKLYSVTSIWNQTDLLRNDRVKFQREHLLNVAPDATLQVPDVIYRSQPTEIDESSRSISKCGNLTAILREVAPAKKSNAIITSEKSQFLDVFCSKTHCKDFCVDLKALEKHGKICTSIGQINFSNGGGHLLYVAEKFRKNVGFFEKKFDEEKYLQDPEVNDEYLRVESWGEQLMDIKRAVICLLNTNTGDVNVLDNIPDNVTPCEPVWSKADKGIYFIGLVDKPSRLGLGACFNRKSKLFYYDIKSATCKMLLENDFARKSLRISPDHSKMAFFEAQCGGAHSKCEILTIMNLENMEFKKVVGIQANPCGKTGFPGIYESNVPTRCWALDNKRILLSSIWCSKTEILVVNTAIGTVSCITSKTLKYGSWNLLDVLDDYLLASNSAPNRPVGLFWSKLPAEGQESDNIVWTKLDKELSKPFDNLAGEIKWDVLKIKRPAEKNEPEELADQEFESIILWPTMKNDNATNAQAKMPPLIVLPHGGPHSTSLATWSAPAAFFLLAGYAILRPNYRGSLGFGENFVNALPGRVGTTDVLDCKYAVDKACEFLKSVHQRALQSPQIFLYGGSHGGFLTGHLIGQYPDLAKAAVAANPVLNLASMMFESDIPDWVIVESFGREYNPKKTITGQELAIMTEKSPIFYVEYVKTPIMFPIGEGDLRVPNAQIKHYVRILESRGVPVKVLTYPNNDHRINKVDAEANQFINILMWFEKYRQ